MPIRWIQRIASYDKGKPRQGRTGDLSVFLDNMVTKESGDSDASEQVLSSEQDNKRASNPDIQSFVRYQSICLYTIASNTELSYFRKKRERKRREAA